MFGKGVVIMHKKLISILLAIVLLFVFAGCGGTDKPAADNPTEEPAVNPTAEPTEEPVDETLVTVNGVELHMTKDAEFNGIKYTITEDLKEANYGRFVQYYLYQDDGPNLLFFRVFYYKGMTHADIRYDLGVEDDLKEEAGKTDNIEYSLIDLHRDDGTMHFYIVDKDDISYVINFVSQYDIANFETLVLNSIRF